MNNNLRKSFIEALLGISIVNYSQLENSADGNDAVDVLVAWKLSNQLVASVRIVFVADLKTIFVSRFESHTKKFCA